VRRVHQHPVDVEHRTPESLLHAPTSSVVV
jgi:hypothetical protein